MASKFRAEEGRMRIAHLSRRLFVKTALAGAAGILIPRIAIGAAPAGGEAQPVANNASLSSLTLSEAAELVHSKKISPVELTKACLGRIEQLNPKLNAFITVTADSALVDARAAEAEIQRGRWKGPLHGIPIALKDLVDTAGVRTTAASGLFKDRVPTQDAEVVRRLRSAGAVLLGKTNLHEFAYGGSSAISYFGPVSNPWNVAYSRGANVLRGDRHRYWRFHPRAGWLLRHCWAQTHVRSGERLGSHTLCVVPGPRRADDEHGHGRRSDAPGHRRLRSAGPGQHRSPGSRLRGHHCRFDLLVATRYSARLVLRGTSSRHSVSHGESPLGSEETHALSARHRSAGDRWHLRIGHESGLHDRLGGNVRVPQGLRS